MPKPTVISLFAGCGGSSLGYKMAGFDVRLAVEWDAKAVKTYKHNFPTTTVFHGDVCALTDTSAIQLSKVKSGELTILDGSPPWQGFSMAGSRMVGDNRNRLFEQYIRLLDVIKPQSFVMENVGGLVSGKMKLVFAEMTSALRNTGYRISCRLLNAAWYGVPQDRKRIIWIGIRNDLNCIPSHPTPTVSRILGVREVLSHMDGMTSGWRSEIKNARYNNEFRTTDKPSPTLNASQPPLIRDGNGSRYINVAEAKILQGFPDDFTVDSYKQIGNSVPPPMTEAIGRHILELLNGKARKKA